MKQFNKKLSVEEFRNKDLQKKYNLTYLFVAHDLLAVNDISDQIGVMYLGEMVELGESDKVYNNPLHPYTKGLIQAVPIPDPKYALDLEKEFIKGEMPSVFEEIKGCKFNTRCRLANDKCRQDAPKLKKIEDGHFVACHKVN